MYSCIFTIHIRNQRITLCSLKRRQNCIQNIHEEQTSLTKCLTAGTAARRIFNNGCSAVNPQRIPPARVNLSEATESIRQRASAIITPGAVLPREELKYKTTRRFKVHRQVMEMAGQKSETILRRF